MIWREAAPRFIRITVSTGLRIQNKNDIPFGPPRNNKPFYHQAPSVLTATVKESRCEYLRQEEITIPKNAFEYYLTRLEPQPQFHRRARAASRDGFTGLGLKANLDKGPTATFLKNDIFYIQDFAVAARSKDLGKVQEALKNVTRIALIDTQLRYSYMKENVKFLSGLEGLQTIYVITDPKLYPCEVIETSDNIILKSPGISDLPPTQYLMAGYVLNKIKLEYRKVKENGWKGTVPEIVWKMPC